mmetsp:Transcript_12821/g.20881  ORF Transcript_12821/g.20881 Transcript_12821/m.20881 type:complete len:99 (-) Transcript_12821:6-302(-)
MRVLQDPPYCCLDRIASRALSRPFNKVGSQDRPLFDIAASTYLEAVFLCERAGVSEVRSSFCEHLAGAQTAPHRRETGKQKLAAPLAASKAQKFPICS